MTDTPSAEPGPGLLRDIDRLLRGGFTQSDELRAGKLRIPARQLLVACLLLGALYGVMMGLYAGTQSDNWVQVFASAIKVPLLFLLTLVVTFPSLYVFSALSRSRLDLGATLRLLLVAITVNLAVLASFGPVTAFFTFSTSSYPFMKVLNVIFFGVAGLIGLGFLRRALEPILGAPAPRTEAVVEEEQQERDEEETGAYVAGVSKRQTLARLPAQVDPARRVFSAWLVIYGAVGAQMGWLLRPFIGTPNMPFQWFRQKESNFLHDIVRTLGDLFA